MASPDTASRQSAMDVDVVVVGAGLSGLLAAYHLLQRGVVSVKVVEGRDRVGGRTFSREIRTAHGKEKWDVGGQWVSSSQHNVMQLIEELGIQTYLQYRDGQRVLFLPDGRVQMYSGDIPPAPKVALIQYKLMLNKVEGFCKRLSVEYPEQCPNAQKWDSMTVEGFIRERGVLFGNKVVREMFKNACRAIFGVEPNELSFLYFLRTCASSGGFLSLAKSDEGSGQESKVKGTAHGISLKLAERIGDDNLILGDCVKSISQKRNDRCLVETTKGLQFNTQFVIVAIPPHQRSHIEFSEPNLPPHYHLLNRHYLPGHMMKCIFTYERAFWRERNCSGEVFGAGRPAVDSSLQTTAGQSTEKSRHRRYENLKQTSAEETSSSLSSDPVLYGFDASVYDGEKLHPALVVFVHPETAALRSAVGDDELRRRILEHAVRFFGEEAASPIDFAIGDWYGKDTPVNNLSPGGLLNYGKLLRQPFGRVHWAGTETATEWIGYMDGAVQSGRRAAEEVIDKLSAK